MSESPRSRRRSGAVVLIRSLEDSLGHHPVVNQIPTEFINFVVN